MNENNNEQNTINPVDNLNQTPLVPQPENIVEQPIVEPAPVVSDTPIVQPSEAPVHTFEQPVTPTSVEQPVVESTPVENIQTSEPMAPTFEQPVNTTNDNSNEKKPFNPVIIIIIIVVVIVAIIGLFFALKPKTSGSSNSGGSNSDNDVKTTTQKVGKAKYSHTISEVTKDKDEYQSKYNYDEYIDKVLTKTNQMYPDLNVGRDNFEEFMFSSDRIKTYHLCKDNKITFGYLSYVYVWKVSGKTLYVYYDPENDYTFEDSDILKQRVYDEIVKVLPSDVTVTQGKQGIRAGGNSWLFSTERGQIVIDKSYSWKQVLDVILTLVANEDVPGFYNIDDLKYIIYIQLNSETENFKAGISKLDELFKPAFKKNDEEIVKNDDPKNSWAKVHYGL